MLNRFVSLVSILLGRIGNAELLEPNPSVDEHGNGAVRVLDSLKTGDREDLFDRIEHDFKRYIPEIEKLSFISGQSNKQLQVRERSITKPISVCELSDGTKLVLTILTIIHQENSPSFIGLEEIDRGLHPRLFQQIIELLFQITEEKDIQIVATTHNPYLVDEFHGREEAVVIVEKENGEMTFTTLDLRRETSRSVTGRKPARPLMVFRFYWRRFRSSKMNCLYILTEDDNDDIFFEGCITKITRDSYELLPRRLRKESRVPAVCTQ